MRTPWGEPEDQRDFAPGFSFVGTPSHGGFALSKEFAEDQLSPEALERAERLGDYYFFEEDVAWAIPAWELREFWAAPGFFGGGGGPSVAAKEEYLLSILSRYFPDYLADTGVEPMPERMAAECGPAHLAEWGVLATRTGGVMGAAAALVKSNGDELVFSTRDEAKDAADGYNSRTVSPNVYYTVVGLDSNADEDSP